MNKLLAAGLPGARPAAELGRGGQPLAGALQDVRGAGQVRLGERVLGDPAPV
jgi:hypothetical protein